MKGQAKLDSRELLQNYFRQEAKKKYKQGFDITLTINQEPMPESTGQTTTFKFWCFEKVVSDPKALDISYHKDGYDGAICFNYDYTRKLWELSIYSFNSTVDCSRIAKLYEGKGSPDTANFTLDNNQFYNLVSNKHDNNT